MRKIVILFFILNSVAVFSQKPQDQLVMANVKAVVLTKKTVVKLPTLDLKTSVETGFKTANAKLIAQYFASNINVSLVGEENLYSKSQAEQVLKTFFLENKPLKFTITHQGKSVKTQYYIGALVTNKGSYRITVNVKLVSNQELISHLTIEQDY